jgi:hypothetical protein
MSGPRVAFRTSSIDQHDELTAYAIVKGFKDLSAFALHAAVSITSKNPLTDAQKAKAEEIMAGLRNTR